MMAPAVAQVSGQGRFIRHHQRFECQRSTGRPHVGRVNVVFQGDRNAMQWSANFALGPFAVAFVRDLHRLGIHRDRRVQQVLIGRNPQQVLADDLLRGDAPLLERGFHLGNRRFHDGEGPAGDWRRSPLRLRARKHSGYTDADGDDDRKLFHGAQIICPAGARRRRYHPAAADNRQSRGSWILESRSD